MPSPVLKNKPKHAIPLANPDESDVRDGVIAIVVGKAKELLETKHLYQSVTSMSVGLESELAKASYFPPQLRTTGANSIQIERHTTKMREELPKLAQLLLDREWSFTTSQTRRVQGSMQHGGPSPQRAIDVELPTINIPCAHCDGVLPPHTPGYGDFDGETTVYSKGNRQLFQFPYLCQTCAIQPLIFFVLREGRKMQLIGRSEFPFEPVPKFIPSEERQYVVRAITAHKSGFHLASFLYLRSFVEQYLRRITNAKNAKLRGDQLSARYTKWLKENEPRFPRSHFVSLGHVYDDLSAHIHAGHDSEAYAEQFKDNLHNVTVHFEQLDLMRRATKKLAAE